MDRRSNTDRGDDDGGGDNFLLLYQLHSTHLFRVLWVYEYPVDGRADEHSAPAIFNLPDHCARDFSWSTDWIHGPIREMGMQPEHRGILNFVRQYGTAPQGDVSEKRLKPGVVCQLVKP